MISQFDGLYKELLNLKDVIIKDSSNRNQCLRSQLPRKQNSICLN